MVPRKIGVWRAARPTTTRLFQRRRPSRTNATLNPATFWSTRAAAGTLSAARVVAPTTPSASSAWRAWKAFTAAASPSSYSEGSPAAGGGVALAGRSASIRIRSRSAATRGSISPGRRTTPAGIAGQPPASTLAR